MIPEPAVIEARTGVLVLAAGTPVYAAGEDAGARRVAGILREWTQRIGGPDLALADRPPRGTAVRLVRRQDLGPEAYRLSISAHGARIEARSDAGLLYGAATLWQLIPPGTASAAIPAQTISDAPAYPWRGLMLDSARHFQSVADVKSVIEWMSWHKLNVLHWHLTDDQGWRLEIRKYPRLTQVGAWRVPATVGREPVARVGGFYSQAEVREIVAYAAEHAVTIVPEIDVPGHAQAAIAAYPSLGAGEDPAPTVSARWGIHTYLLNPEEATLRFLEDVFEEVVQLFPGPYVHVGGDEVVRDEWRRSARVVARLHELGIADVDGLQPYFTARLGRFLAAHGRRLVGWDEILRPGLPADAVVMSWHGTSGARAAALAGNDAVLAPWPTLYLDNRQSSLPQEPTGRTQVVSLEDVYRFAPEDPSLPAHARAHVRGVQGNLWTEHIPTRDMLEWMALPRAAAIAELGWTPAARRDWRGFLQRLAATRPRYAALGLHAADSAFAVHASLQAAPGHLEVRLGNQSHVGTIRYTADGREPTADSAAYGDSIEVAPGATLAAATFLGAQRLSGTWTQRTDAASLARRNSRELELCSDGVGLLLDARGGTAEAAPLALDIMDPCWIYRGADLSAGPGFRVRAVPLPFNFELAADLAHVKLGSPRGAAAELEVHVGSCQAPPAAVLALDGTPSPQVLRGALPAATERRDVCLRFARPTIDPLWALDWVELGVAAP
ncbi:MAG: family 20 glycosylhydrolase [Proteobacteria bacterium]|nr:family 20 glycosylhydrolase [Pseudomonadota bacterium]